MRGLLTSLRYTIRLLFKSPGFTITAILILGFGIGANTAIFSLIDAVLLNALPFPKADRLIHIFQPRANDAFRSEMDYPDYLDIRAANHSFDILSVSYWWYLDLSGQGQAKRLTAVFTSPELFKITNFPFLLGRPFSAEEDKLGGSLVTVLSESLWRGQFNSDPNIIGKNLILSGQSFQVIGICPRQVEDLSTPPTDVLYVPLHVSELFQGTWLDKRDERGLFCWGRLKDGVNCAQAQTDLEVLQNNLVAQYPAAEKGHGIRVVPLLDTTVETYSGTVWLLGAAVGCVLLISTANVANLLLVRALDRRKEMAIRATLGASRRRLIGQVLLETGFLSLLGGAVGLLIALVSIEAIKALSSADLHRFQELSLDTTALCFIFVLTALVSLLSGFIPAWSLSKTRLGSALKDEAGRGGTTGLQRQRTQSLLVGGQVALACVLLIAAGLLVRSFLAAQTLALGFNPDHLLSVDINPTSKEYADMPRLRNLFNAVLEKVRQLSGITSAAMNEEQPFEWTFSDPSSRFWLPGRPEPEPGKELTMCAQNISPGYFETLQIPLLEGRDFTADDRLDSRAVVIVDQALAQRCYPGQTPIGKQIQTREGLSGVTKSWTIVGVVQNSRHNSPDHPLAPFQTYFPYSQREDLYRQFLLVRAQGDPSVLTPTIRKVIASVDPDVPVTQVTTLNEVIAKRFWARRLGVLLVGIFSGVALFLSAVGLYGVLAYSVAQRRREIGVRIALGAESSNIVVLVVRHGLKLVCMGLAAGLVTALLLVRFIESGLYGISGNDPVTLVSTVLVLGTTALLACLLPALRAARINPITALRE